MSDLGARIKRLEKIFLDMQIIGEGWSGDVSSGFIFEPTKPSKMITSQHVSSVTFSGQILCCISSGGVTYSFPGVIGGMIPLTQTGPNTWSASDPSCFSNLNQYCPGHEGACPGGSNCFGSCDGICDFTRPCFGGAVTVTFSGSTWTVQSYTIIGGIHYFDFNGTSSSNSVPNGIGSCSGVVLGSGGTATVNP